MTSGELPVASELMLKSRSDTLLAPLILLFMPVSAGKSGS